jgi:hypothetical protein
MISAISFSTWTNNVRDTILILQRNTENKRIDECKISRMATIRAQGFTNYHYWSNIQEFSSKLIG